MAGFLSHPNVTNGTQSPDGQRLETAAPLDEQWRPVEDDDWRSQLESSTNNDLHLAGSDPSREGHDAPSSHSRHDSASPKLSEQSSQPVPAKIALLTRPSSSHEDPAAGFSFTKAKPMQPLDFSRNRKTNGVLPASPEILDASNQVELQTNKYSQQSSKQGQKSTLPAMGPEKATLSPQRDTGSARPFAVPFPDIATQLSPLSEGRHRSLPNHTNEHHSRQPASEKPAGKVVLISGDDTLVGSDINEMSNASSQNEALKSLNRLIAHAPPHLVKHSPHQSHLIQTSTGKASPVPEVQASTRPKVRKIRKRVQALVPSGEGQFRKSHRSLGSSEDDLLQALYFKHEKNGQERAALLRNLQVKDTEYQTLFAASEDLYDQLQNMSERYGESEAQLTKLKESKSGWEKTVKKLSDYIKGLTNDHNRLRDDAKNIRDRQNSVIEDKRAILKTLRDVYNATENSNSRAKRHISEARQDLEMLGRTVRDQQVQLQQEQSLLLSERERNNRLETQISTFTAKHDQLSLTFREYREVTTGKLDELIRRAVVVQSTDPPASQEHLTPMLEQCVSLLKSIPKSEGVQEADLQKLNDSMRSYCESIARSVNFCEQGTTIVKEEQRQLALSMETQLNSLNSHIVVEHSLSERIMDLREIKATIKERLYGTEAALKDARAEIARLQDKVSEQSKKIMYFENEIRIRQPSEDPKTACRLQELETLNRQLQKDIAAQTTEVSSLHEQLQEKDEEHKLQEDQLAERQLRLEEAHQQVAAVQEEKSRSECQATLEREEMRSQLSKAANQQLDEVKSKHLNEIQQLKSAHSSAQESYKEASLQLIMMRHEKERREKEADDAKIALKTAQEEKQIEIDTANRLRFRVDELERQLQAKEKSIQAVKQELRDTILDIEAKDDYIKAYHDASAKKKARQSPSVRGFDGSQSHLGSTSVVVEDSQPTGHSGFVNLADIMGDRAGSPLLAPNEDFSGFFPVTPTGQAQPRDIEIEQVTYSRSKTTSRDQVNGPREPARGVPPRPRSLVNRPSSTSTHQDSSTRESQPTIPIPRPTSSKSPVNTSHKQQSSQVKAPAPRGILKTSAQASRGEKRNATELGPHNAAGFSVKRRRSGGQANMTKDLGPIVQDSQSPVNALSSRARKQTVARKSSQDDKYTKAFNQRLNRH